MKTWEGIVFAIGLLFIFAFPQVLYLVFILAAMLCVAMCIVEKIQEKKKS